ncbi:prepilin peptidase [Lactobacillus sp. LL6]|uniref:prepilin peptidase n=1 Tax=Lactobacillus sp. LL6 TaxID=2596827 RepID=UPI00164280A5|nr:prepilin peptidase [Lactobacillus sp. LL6]
MNNIFLISNFFIGSCLASHAYVIYDRFYQGNYILDRSKCTYCHTELNILEEIPVFSYIFLHGQCSTCKFKIPAELFFIELIGGFSFSNCDFATTNGITTAILIFSILLCTIFDYYSQEFPTICIIPAIIVSLYNFSSFTTLDLMQSVPIFIVLLFYVYKQKLGSGDLILYLILVFYFHAEFANYTFLLASLFCIVHYFLNKKRIDKNQQIALFPYLFLSLIIFLM